MSRATGKRRHRTRTEHGSAAIEAAVGLPAFVLFVGMIIVGGRLAISHQALEAAAAEAARTASIARSAPEAAEGAKQAALASIRNQGITCSSVDVHSDTRGFAAAVGQDASVEVTVSCRVDLSDVSIPGVPGSRTITATISSPIDTWRERS